MHGSTLWGWSATPGQGKAQDEVVEVRNLVVRLAWGFLVAGGALPLLEVGQLESGRRPTPGRAIAGRWARYGPHPNA